MKKITTILAASAVFAVASQGQTLIAGFDFDTFEGTNGANYSDLAFDGPASAPFATFSFMDGTGNPFPATVASDVNVAAGNILNSEFRVTGLDDEFGAGGSLLAQDLPPIASSDGGWFEFDVNAGSVFTDLQFGFAASVTQAGTSTVDVSYSLNDGGDFTSLGSQDINVLQSAGGQSFLLDVTGVSASDILLRVTFTDISSGVYFDNVQLAGVVPEPSSYGAIVGAMTLAFVALRRRK